MTVLSVIVPTWNAATVLPGCLASLACQTFREFEVLVMDGESSDGTLAVVDEYRARLPGLRVTSERDGGIYQAMNRGLEAARGEFVMFFGADDAVHDGNVFECLFGGCHRRVLARSDLVYGDTEVVPQGNTIRGAFRCSDFFTRNICHQSILYRTEALRSIGGFEVAYRALADWLANVRFFCDPRRRVSHVPELICRFHSGGFHADYAESPEFYTRRDTLLNEFLRFDSWTKAGCLRWWQAHRDWGALSGRAFGLGAFARRVARRLTGRASG